MEGRLGPGRRWAQVQVVPHSVSHVVTAARGSADSYVPVTYTGTFVLSEGLPPVQVCLWTPVSGT